MSAPLVITSAVPVPAQGRDLVRYAAAFIHPAIESVRIEDGAFVVGLSERVDPAFIDAGIARLVERFSAGDLPEPEPIFELAPPADFPDRAADIPAPAMQGISPGLFIFRAPYSDLLRFLDWAVLERFAARFGAREEVYPNVIPVATLSRTQHFTSFPEHVHFVTHLIEDLDVIDGFVQRARADAPHIHTEPGEMAGPELVHNPATCYHCYAALEGQSLEGDVAVTAISKCHRFESANHSERGRLLEFSLREVIFLGAPDYVRATRGEVLGMAEKLATDWQLYGRLVPANDPFFTSDFKPKAAQQHRLAMKFEFKAALPGGRELAVMSSNLHGPTFGKSFAIKANGRPANTGCLGFGLERLAIALFAQHGPDPRAWPEGLRDDFERWRERDPLTA